MRSAIQATIACVCRQLLLCACRMQLFLSPNFACRRRMLIPRNLLLVLCSQASTYSLFSPCAFLEKALTFRKLLPQIPRSRSPSLCDWCFHREGTVYARAVRRVLLGATAVCDSGADLQGNHATAVPLLIQPSGAIARDSWDIMTSVAGFPCAPVPKPHTLHHQILPPPPHLSPLVGFHALCVDGFGVL